MSNDTIREQSAKAEFEPSVLIEYGDAAELTRGPGQAPGVESPYLS